MVTSSFVLMCVVGTTDEIMMISSKHEMRSYGTDTEQKPHKQE
jgi:hypothetical protein